MQTMLTIQTIVRMQTTLLRILRAETVLRITLRTVLRTAPRITHRTAITRTETSKLLQNKDTQLGILIYIRRKIVYNVRGKQMIVSKYQKEERMRKFELIAPCHFGMEAVLKKEIIDLGYDVTEVADGRITFWGD